MDQHLFFLINHTWTAPWLDMPMAAASSWDFWWPLGLVGGVLLLIFGGRRGFVFLLLAGLSVGVTDALVVDTLKGAVGRPRPHEILEGVRTIDLANAQPRFLALARPLRVKYSVARIHPPAGNSFPSGHASNNFAVATVCALVYRRWGWVAFLPAAFVSYSRIYVGSHWPLDVVVSCFLGAGIALLVVAFASWIWTRWGPKFLPRWSGRHPELLES
jgi:undecaprenyl-diphosphatase